jgi:hypothetical protein
VTTSRPRDFCPHCGVAYEPLQEYCLECGRRLPTNRGLIGYLASRWQRRFAWYPGDWMWPALLFLVLSAAAAAGSVAAASARKSSAPGPLVATGVAVTVGPGAPRGTIPTATSRSTLPAAPAPTITTGPLPIAPGAPSTSRRTTPARTATNPNALAEWPVGKTGYTDIIESLPVAAGLAAAEAKARAAKRAGLADVGVLPSGHYSSLHPGYFVVFAGIFGTNAEAVQGLEAARKHGYPDAYQTKVTR